MRILKYGIVILAAGIGSAVLANPAAPRGEVGYATGALGYDALVAGDLNRAETQLNAQRGVSANDPARLLNLANVYMRTGRTEEARALLLSVRDSRSSFDVELADGRVASTRDVARLAIARMDRVAGL